MNRLLPQMACVQQIYPPSRPLDIRTTVGGEFAKVIARVRPGAKIAVGVGSRGIANLATIVESVLEVLKSAGAIPFIFPAMGSHGGATPEGQRDILASYGITEVAMGVPIRASLEVQEIGATSEGTPVFCSIEALTAEGIVLINRIKPHTDFTGTLGSGIIKMCVVGLGKREGAAAMHAAAARSGHEHVIRKIAEVMIRTAPILCGLAILENQLHETASLIVLPREEIESSEGQLLLEARQLMARLPFEEIDLLIVDRLGKNISGAGMDPNVTGRWVDGYSSLLARGARSAPFIRRIFVRDLTAETHGNAIGIGLADLTTLRLVRAINHRFTYINALTSLAPQCAKIPIHFETDREAIEMAMNSLGMSDWQAARIVRIPDTLSLVGMQVSESLFHGLGQRADLSPIGGLEDMRFDETGMLL
jgi:hypothetical protein